MPGQQDAGDVPEPRPQQLLERLVGHEVVLQRPVLRAHLRVRGLATSPGGARGRAPGGGAFAVRRTTRARRGSRCSSAARPSRCRAGRCSRGGPARRRAGGPRPRRSTESPQSRRWLPEDPQVARLRDRFVGRLGNVVEVLLALHRADGLLGVVGDALHLLVVEAERGEHVGRKRLEFGRQPDRVPLGEFGGAVVGDREPAYVGAVEVGGDARDVGPAERPRRFERAVARDDDAVGRDDDRLLLAEAGERVRDRLEVALGVGAGVRGVEVKSATGRRRGSRPGATWIAPRLTAGLVAPGSSVATACPSVTSSEWSFCAHCSSARDAQPVVETSLMRLRRCAASRSAVPFTARRCPALGFSQ